MRPANGLNNIKQVASVDAEYTWEQVAAHNTKNDAWIAIRGKVYNITKFIARHPGGEDALLLSIGRDATYLFETYHDLRNVDLVLKKYYIGKLISDELPTFPAPSEFARTVRIRVYDYFKKNNLDLKNHPESWVFYTIFIGLPISLYYLQFFVPFVMERFWLQLILAVAFGWSIGEMGMHTLHDGSHFNVTHQPWVWKLLGATNDFIIGASYLVWLYQHTVGHHMYTNIDQADPDVATRGDQPDLRRILKSQKWFSYYSQQHWLAPIVYGLLGFKTRFQDIYVLYILRSNEHIRINPPTAYHHAIFWIGKIFFVLHRLVLPLLLLPTWKALVLYQVADTTMSYWLSITFQANHVVDGVQWPLPDSDNRVHVDWAELQVQTTVDYAHGSWFWTLITGALNYQAVHHLFPEIHQHYYQDIGPIVVETAKEFGIPYTIKKSYWEAVSGHLQFLRTMGKNPQLKAL